MKFVSPYLAGRVKINCLEMQFKSSHEIAEERERQGYDEESRVASLAPFC